MIRINSIDDIKALQSNLRATLGNDTGKEIMKFLESVCGWYDFKETDPQKILIAHGKRQVLATIKTLLDKTPEQVFALIKENGDV